MLSRLTPERISAIAHGALRFHNPLPEHAFDTLVDLLALRPGEQSLDVGCGRGELLIRFAERSGAGGLGIDASVEQIELARREAAARVPRAQLVFERGDAAALAPPAESFAAAACIGSTHALGGLEPALERLAGLVRDAGYVLIGEGYWPHAPGPELLSLLGAQADELTSLPELLEAGARRGLSLVHLTVASEADWRRYEWAYVFNLDRYLRDHGDEEGLEELEARLQRIRRRRLLAERDGEGLGFALVAWRRG